MMMNNILKYLAILTASLVLISCEDNPGGTTGVIDPKPVSLGVKSVALVGSSNDFAFDFFEGILASEDGSKNIMISPLSASLALAMAYNGAVGETKLAMEEALRLQGLTPDEINKSFKELINILTDLDPKVAMEIANSIWYRNTVTVKPVFIQTNQNYYNAEVTPLDFNNPESKDIVNQWVSDHTHGKIDQIIDNINPLDIMYLINAIYFKGTWSYRFDADNTESGPFTLGNGTVINVPTMYMKADVDYFSNDHAEAIVLPYGQGNFRMAVILPNEGNTPDAVADLMTDEIWNQWITGKYKRNELEIYLPKFKFEFKKQLKDVLTAMGMGIAFSETDADFSGVSDELYLYITSVLQKTFIEVNEEGTEAAAVTSVTFGTTSVGPDPWFKADHPFLFVIYEQETNAILFMGKVVNPLLAE